MNKVYLVILLLHVFGDIDSLAGTGLLKDYRLWYTPGRVESFALFFAVKDYEDTRIQDLNNPIKDADAIAWELENHYGFKVRKYNNPSLKRIIEVIESWQKKTFESNSQLFVFFSGHGTYRAFNELGYFIPHDAKYENHATYLDLISLGNSVFKIPCGHILLAIDACYSGNIHEINDKDIKHSDRNDILNSIRQKDIIFQQLQYKSRLVITSGGKNMRTPDGKKHSPFSNAIITGLRREYTHGDGLLVYAELLSYFAQGIHPIPHEGKWNFGDHQDEGGGFVFISNTQPGKTEERDRFDRPNIEAEIARGVNLFDRRKYTESFTTLNQYCDLTVFPAEAQNRLGVMYALGKGTRRNEYEALKYFTRSAESGDPVGQYNLGNLYQFGERINKDLYRAVFWYRKSAEGGNSTGQFYLAQCYYNGNGVSKDDHKGSAWMLKAAQQGNEKGMVNMGASYLLGRGVEQNENKAAGWFRKAAELGNATAMLNLGQLYYEGKGVEKDDSAALDWFTKAAQSGDDVAQAKLGTMYLIGHRGVVDYGKAEKWLRKSSEAGNPTGQYNLAVMYENGYGVNKDVHKAVELYRKAAEKGLDEARKALKRLGLGW